MLLNESHENGARTGEEDDPDQHRAPTNNKKDEGQVGGQYCYIFGFGSIINTDTHAPWLNIGATTDKNDIRKKLEGQPATILKSFGYRRGWIFRSNTGFTALGVQKHLPASDINGVLFRISIDQLLGFDQREVGYDRVQIQHNYIKLSRPEDYQNNDNQTSPQTDWCNLNIHSNEPIFIYIPQIFHQANEQHPILQSYVDTVMQGCLEWGGAAMATQFVSTTYNWSQFFLNDTPSSRRPWLFRKQYLLVDRILRENPKTHFQDRQHPEQFASSSFGLMTYSGKTTGTSSSTMRGTWSVPRRNPNFIGRDSELGKIHAKLTDNTLGEDIKTLEIAGMGGIGKSQLAAEYCYRFFPSFYGLVIWLRAQSSESIVAGFRQLMVDTTPSDQLNESNKDTNEVVAEIKARLFRSQVTWLLVFDNLEERSLLQKFVPHGGKGHVLITTRLLANPSVSIIPHSSDVMMLGCFQPSESVELLVRSTNITKDSQAVVCQELATRLGHLPLALGMASAYMNRCDVDCSEYLTRYNSGDSQRNIIGHQIVESSLSLSLNAIQDENFLAWEMLRLLGWLGPDQITKALVRSLLQNMNTMHQKQEEKKIVNAERENAAFMGGAVAIGMFIFSFLRSERRRKLTPVLLAGVGTMGLLIVLSSSLPNRKIGQSSMVAKGIPSSAERRKSDVFGVTDEVWTVLKLYSLLVVKEGKGSIHRLLAQCLRGSQEREEVQMNLEICLQVMKQTWVFKQDQVETWQASADVLEHVKAVIFHISQFSLSGLALDAAILSLEVGVFSAMALNRFEEAQHSLELSLTMLEHAHGNHHKRSELMNVQSTILHELGRVLRYDGKFCKSEEALQSALEIRKAMAAKDWSQKQKVALTFHELGILEVKKHNLDAADIFLQKALVLRRNLDYESPESQLEAECASTLHQLAAVQLAKKPPSLDKAETFLNEALGLNMQIVQRAATLKQLARVSIRRGEFDKAEKCLTQALELYEELYGENAVHINIAAVKFQQGVLAFQKEYLDQAFILFSECLKIRQSVYAYCQGNHLEVSTVLHELGCVELAQKRDEKACEFLSAERDILDQLYETTDQGERMYQARLTNLTWLRKCAKERGDEDGMKLLLAARLEIKHKHKKTSQSLSSFDSNSGHKSLQRLALHSRLLAREFALSTVPSDTQSLRESLSALEHEIQISPPGTMRDAASVFSSSVRKGLASADRIRILPDVLDACDNLRDVLREHGVKVSDSTQI